MVLNLWTRPPDPNRACSCPTTRLSNCRYHTPLSQYAQLNPMWFGAPLCSCRGKHRYSLLHYPTHQTRSPCQVVHSQMQNNNPGLDTTISSWNLNTTITPLLPSLMLWPMSPLPPALGLRYYTAAQLTPVNLSQANPQTGQPSLIVALCWFLRSHQLRLCLVQVLPGTTSTWSKPTRIYKTPSKQRNSSA